MARRIQIANTRTIISALGRPKLGALTVILEKLQVDSRLDQPKSTVQISA